MSFTKGTGHFEALAELERIALLVAAHNAPAPVFFLMGEKGVGKRKLIDELALRLAAPSSPYSILTADLAHCLEGADSLQADSAARLFSQWLNEPEELLARVIDGLGWAGADVVIDELTLYVQLVMQALRLHPEGIETALNTMQSRPLEERTRTRESWERLKGLLDNLLSKGPVLITVHSAQYLKPVQDHFVELLQEWATLHHKSLMLVLLVDAPSSDLPGEAATTCVEDLVAVLDKKGRSAAFTLRPADGLDVSDYVRSQLPHFSQDALEKLSAQAVELCQGRLTWVDELISCFLIGCQVADDCLAGQPIDSEMQSFLELAALVGETFPAKPIAIYMGMTLEQYDELSDFMDDNLVGQEKIVIPLGAKGHQFEGVIAYRFSNVWLHRQLAAQASRRASLKEVLKGLAESIEAAFVDPSPEVCRELALLWHRAGERQRGQAWLLRCDQLMSQEQMETWRSTGSFVRFEGQSRARLFVTSLLDLVALKAMKMPTQWAPHHRTVAASLAHHIAVLSGASELVGPAKYMMFLSLRESGNLTEALQLLEDAVKGFRESNNLLWLASGLHARGQLLTSMGQAEKGLEDSKLALDLHEKLVGQDDARTGFSHHSIGMALVAMGRPGEGIAHLMRAVRTLELGGGATHPSVLQVRRHAGQALIVAGRPAEAVKVLQVALENHIELYEEDHLEVGAIHFDLGMALAQLGRKSEACGHLERARDIANGYGNQQLVSQVDGLLALLNRSG